LRFRREPGLQRRGRIVPMRRIVDTEASAEHGLLSGRIRIAQARSEVKLFRNTSLAAPAGACELQATDRARVITGQRARYASIESNDLIVIGVLQACFIFVAQSGSERNFRSGAKLILDVSSPVVEGRSRKCKWRKVSFVSASASSARLSYGRLYFSYSATVPNLLVALKMLTSAPEVPIFFA